LERANLVTVLKQVRWKISGPGGAAEFLGINPGTLTSRMRALGITRSQEEKDYV
jgi:transcriptional regulator with GAF, ATPase, and Fis domain